MIQEDRRSMRRRKDKAARCVLTVAQRKLMSLKSMSHFPVALATKAMPMSESMNTLSSNIISCSDRYLEGGFITITYRAPWHQLSLFSSVAGICANLMQGIKGRDVFMICISKSPVARFYRSSVLSIHVR
jgi:hypothetical protein